MTISPLVLSLLFCVGTVALGALRQALLRLKKRDMKKALRLSGNLFFYKQLSAKLFRHEDEDALSFAAIVTLNTCRFFTVFFLALWYEEQGFRSTPILIQILGFSLILALLYLIADYLPKRFANKSPAQALYLAAPVASPFLLVTLPLTWILHRVYRRFAGGSHIELLNEPMGEFKQELFEILHDAEITSKLSLQDKKMIESVVRFQTKIAREVMVPRIDMFALEAGTSIKAAAKALQSEGYSRVPVYKDTIDHIVGILMYRDLLSKYMTAEAQNNPKILDAPIETLVKKVLFAPETKKISHLLQDFKKKQTHLAIVVDEYGGTAGIVTIEDLLEEIVGEIEDEYDEEEELYTSLSDSVWLADGRLSILDAEEQLGIHLPDEGEFDTIGGFIFHRAGSIPSKGFKIQLDDLELEVVKSNDRRVEKVKIRKKMDIHG